MDDQFSALRTILDYGRRVADTVRAIVTDVMQRSSELSID